MLDAACREMDEDHSGAVRVSPDEDPRFRDGRRGFVPRMVKFAISISFPVLTTSLGPTWTFLVFVLLGVLGIAFISTSMPETKGKSLEETRTRVPRPILILRSRPGQARRACPGTLTCLRRAISRRQTAW
ncbi:MFS transporter [Amycolatopsis taiwanensis]|uniref:Uncharacterized protein n=1 Tax=Amycolatopsis taiwanensis TaxID=342230 RepID=A0A9W6R800_9PSEU|nr:MFS transporter [Amycolatopsis taiwanensis]GLY70513.1 hypothetical protein Atai01_71320 [Amycolatopsis taiwanensis]